MELVPGQGRRLNYAPSLEGVVFIILPRHLNLKYIFCYR